MRAPLTRIALAAAAAVLCAGAAFAQEASAAWVRYAPGGEGFAVLMPKEPSSSPERAAAEELKVEGRRYEAADEEGRRYVVWSLKDPANLGERFARANYVSEVFRGEGLYLDHVAGVAWELLVTPLNEKARAEGRTGEHWRLSYEREFRLDGRPARAYTMMSKTKIKGPVLVCADGPRVYVVAALGADANDPRLKQFVESFTLRPDAPARVPLGDPATGKGGGVGTGGGSGVGTGQGVGAGGSATEPGAPVDYNRTFRQGEVTQKAVATFKPEPGFTEHARRFNVAGVVRLRAVLDKTGVVRDISVVKGLPHGLTSKAIQAARQIKFQPAQKDGRAVSQYIVLEYNFNIY
jgi:TonB family protein